MAMTVGQLISALQEYNPDDLVILAKDAEGNGFSPLGDIGDGLYTAESTWAGEVQLKELTPELEEQGFSEEDVGSVEDGDAPCVTLWPVN